MSVNATRGVELNLSDAANTVMYHSLWALSGMFTISFPAATSQQAHRVFLATCVERPSFASSRFIALQVL